LWFLTVLSGSPDSGGGIRLASQPVTQAHQSHFYQRALDGGVTVYQIVVRIFAIKLVLTGLSVLTVLRPSPSLPLLH
jgi:hypothetical protein